MNATIKKKRVERKIGINATKSVNNNRFGLSNKNNKKQ